MRSGLRHSAQQTLAPDYALDGERRGAADGMGIVGLAVLEGTGAGPWRG